MKNLITLLALATISLTACQKTQYADRKKNDNPRIGISGFIVDSQGHPQANITYTSQLGELPTKYSTISQTDVRTNAAGYFNTTLRIPEGGAQVNLVEKNSFKVTYFRVEPPIEKWRDVGIIKVGDIRYMH
jgi:hypothetical protein